MHFDLLGSLEPHPSGDDDAAPAPVRDTHPAVCSRRGCRAAARWALRWNNPRVHTPERRKTWLACDEHREHLADFLGQRGFLKSVDPFQDPAPAPDGCAPGSEDPAATPEGPAREVSAPGPEGATAGTGGRRTRGGSGVVGTGSEGRQP